jgi:hypothetical protein
MREIRFWFGWLPIILVLHGVEQLLLGLVYRYGSQTSWRKPCTSGQPTQRDQGNLVRERNLCAFSRRY